MKLDIQSIGEILNLDVCSRKEALTSTLLSGLAADSRQVAPGFLFAVVPGTVTHGEVYLEKAVQRGCVAILAEADVCARTRYPHLVCLKTPNVRQTLAKTAALFYPEIPRFKAAVTGTNGKSSVVGFARQLWTLLGEKAASLGTLGLETTSFSPDLITPLPPLTTPDAVSLHRCLHELKTLGKIDYLALEAASHGLDQYRLDGVLFQVGVFTNFSRDHLDYHPDEKAYFEAKSRLFSDLLEKGGKAIICADTKEKAALKGVCEKMKLDVWTYGREGETLQILSRTATPQGQQARLRILGQERDVFVPLVGFFQLQNILAAIGVVMASGFSAEEIFPLIQKLKGINGRLEWVGSAPQGGDIYVDYAHTPDALQTVLQSLRPHTKRNLGVVFGCGGERDHGKRTMMGKLAALEANWVIVTDDNPRQEDPAAIRRDILRGCPDGIDMGDRREAIHQSLRKLKKGDICVIAGKGHETGQLVGDTTLPFQDRDVVQRFLKEGIL